jgi:integrase
VSIRRRGKRSYQVRVAPFPAKSLPTRAAAERYELELLLRRAQGDRLVQPARTLGDELDGWLARHRASGGTSARTIEFYERSSKIWASLRDVKVSALTRAVLDDFIAERAARHPRSARNELEQLKRVLREARARGQRVDEGVLNLRPIPHRAREGRALSVAELQELASWFPQHSKRLVLLAGMVGARQRVWFELTDDLLDTRARTLRVPASLAKNRRAHVIYLTEVETHLFREQLLIRPSKTALVFPTPTGRQWTRSGFRERVWVPTLAAAAREPSGSVYEGFTFHLLRHTAASLMAMAGMDPAAAAERLGHSDGGALFLRRYRHLYEAEKRAQASRLESLVRADLDAIWTGDSPDVVESLNEAVAESGRTWDRTRDLPRVKGVVVSNSVSSPSPATGTCSHGIDHPPWRDFSGRPDLEGGGLVHPCRIQRNLVLARA